jgi:hypothetical protein
LAPSNETVPYINGTGNFLGYSMFPKQEFSEEDFPKEDGPTWLMGAVRTVPPKSGQPFSQLFGVAILKGHPDLPSDATSYWKGMYSQNSMVTSVYKMVVSLYYPTEQMAPSTETRDACRTFILKDGTALRSGTRVPS